MGVGFPEVRPRDIRVVGPYGTTRLLGPEIGSGASTVRGEDRTNKRQQAGHAPTRHSHVSASDGASDVDGGRAVKPGNTEQDCVQVATVWVCRFFGWVYHNRIDGAPARCVRGAGVGRLPLYGGWIDDLGAFGTGRGGWGRRRLNFGKRGRRRQFKLAHRLPLYAAAGRDAVVLLKGRQRPFGLAADGAIHASRPVAELPEGLLDPPPLPGRKRGEQAMRALTGTWPKDLNDCNRAMFRRRRLARESHRGGGDSKEARCHHGRRPCVSSN